MNGGCANNSQMQRAPRARKKIQVVAEIIAMKGHNIPKLAHDEDTIVLSYLGHESIHKQNFTKEDAVFNYEK